jgi:hypothetical protein
VLLPALYRSAGFVVALALLVVVVGRFAPTTCGVRFVPAFDHAQAVLGWLVVASFLILVFYVVRRIEPRPHVGFVIAAFLVQGLVVFLGEVVVAFGAPGELFAPTYQSSQSGPDGRTAHLYAGGMSCRYEVFIAERGAMTMTRVHLLPQNNCSGPYPRLEWNADGTVRLVNADGTPTKSEGSEGLFGRPKGC